MNEEMPAIIALIIVVISLAAFVWMALIIMAHADGEGDARRDEWKNDHRGPLTRWAYLWGRWSVPRKSMRRARRAKINEQKRSRKAEAKAFGS